MDERFGNMILKITDYNWNMIGPGEWVSTEWMISDDLSVVIKEERKDMSGNVLSSETYTYILKENLTKILNLIEKAKSKDKEVEANDGEAWEFVQYSDGNIIWKREIAYIYGIKPLEKIKDILCKIDEYKMI